MSKPVPGLRPVSEEDGNLGDISKAGSLHEFLMDLHKQYGPIASFWWGKMYTISIASAELFEAQEHLFNRHPGPYKAQFQALMESKCIQFANKEDGLNRRRHYNQGLTVEACRKFIPQLQEVADELVGKWGKMLDDPKIPLGHYTSLYALKILLHTLFGNLMKDDKDELDFMNETDEVWAELELGLVKRRTTERAKHMDEGKKDLRKLTLQMIRDRKNYPPNPGEEVLLDLFISFLDDEDLQEADALEFCTAGNFVMESLLTSAVFYLATHPDVDKKLQEEFKTVLGDKDVNASNIDKLVYTQQVIDETLRCSVNVPWGCRYYEVDTKLGGYNIPKNTPMIHALGVAMKNEKVWPEPDKFNPDRFSKANCEGRSKFWFSPFGVGRRQCLVHNFPSVATTVMLVSLLRKFKFQLTDPQQQMIPVYGLITHPKEEIFVSLSKR